MCEQVSSDSYQKGRSSKDTKVDSEPKVRAGKLRRDSKEWNRLKDEKAIQTSIDYYRVIIKCKGHECNFVRVVSRVYK